MLRNQIVKKLYESFQNKTICNKIKNSAQRGKHGLTVTVREMGSSLLTRGVGSFLSFSNSHTFCENPKNKIHKKVFRVLDQDLDWRRVFYLFITFFFVGLALVGLFRKSNRFPSPNTTHSSQLPLKKNLFFLFLFLIFNILFFFGYLTRIAKSPTTRSHSH